MLLRVLVFWFVGIFISAIYGDTIYLHDGSSILGEITDSIPLVSYTLKREDGTIQVFKMEEIWKTGFEEKGIYEDILYLKDGSVITGEIIGSIPGETYRIKTQDKSILVYKMDDVLRIEFGKKPTPQPPIEPPSPKPTPVFKPQLPPSERKTSIKLWLGADFPSMEEANNAIKEYEELLINILHEWSITTLIQPYYSYTSKRTWIERGVNIGGDLTINIKKQNLELLGRVEHISYPEFGLDFQGEAMDAHGNYLALESKIHYKPSLTIIAGGISGSRPLTQKLFFNGEGLFGYGLGNVDLNFLNDSTKVDEGGLFLSFGGNMEYKLSPQFSIMTRAGYKRCSLKMDIPKEFRIFDKNGKEVSSMTFNFSGFYLGGGLKLAFK